MGAAAGAAQAQGMASLWWWVLCFAIVAFGGMVVVCGILGFRDILSLFQALEQEPDTLDK